MEMDCPSFFSRPRNFVTPTKSSGDQIYTSNNSLVVFHLPNLLLYDAVYDVDTDHTSSTFTSTSSRYYIDILPSQTWLQANTTIQN